MQGGLATDDAMQLEAEAGPFQAGVDSPDPQGCPQHSAARSRHNAGAREPHWPMLQFATTAPVQAVAASCVNCRCAQATPSPIK
jgi:hypothetical protein